MHNVDRMQRQIYDEQVKLFLQNLKNVGKILCIATHNKNPTYYLERLKVGNSDKKKIKIDKETIIKILDKPKNENCKIHEKSSIGIINGLYATESCSGGIVPIQITGNHFGSKNKFVLEDLNEDDNAETFFSPSILKPF